MIQNIIKKTFLDKLSILKNLRKTKKVNKKQFKDSIFNKFLEGIDQKSELYQYVCSTIELCENALQIGNKKNIINEKIESIDKRLSEIESFHNLTEDETNNLKNLLDRFVNISQEKTSLLNQLSSFNNTLSYLEPLENDAIYSLNQIDEAEKKQRILRQDIGFIEGEKADLEYEKTLIEKGLKFIYYFSVVLLIGFITGTVLIGLNYASTGNDITVPATIISIGLVFLITSLYVFKRRAKFELELNIKKQNRAIELLNKKNVVIAYYTNFLRFEYKKYKVGNSQILKNNLSELEHYRHISKRYDNIRKIMYKTEEEIDNFMRHKNIVNNDASIVKFSQTISLEDKRNYYNELTKEKEILNNDLNTLELNLEEIWDILIGLNENDISKDLIINDVIQYYFDIVNKNQDLKQEEREDDLDIDKELVIV